MSPATTSYAAVGLFALIVRRRTSSYYTAAIPHRGYGYDLVFKCSYTTDLHIDILR